MRGVHIFFYFRTIMCRIIFSYLNKSHQTYVHVVIVRIRCTDGLTNESPVNTGILNLQCLFRWSGTGQYLASAGVDKLGNQFNLTIVGVVVLHVTIVVRGHG